MGNEACLSGAMSTMIEAPRLDSKVHESTVVFQQGAIVRLDAFGAGLTTRQPDTRNALYFCL